MLRAQYSNLGGLRALATVGLNEIAQVSLRRKWDREENRKEPWKDTVYLECVEQMPKTVCKRVTKSESPCEHAAMQLVEDDRHQ